MCFDCVIPVANWYQFLSFLSLFSLFHTASKDLAQTSYFMATNRLLSCPSFVALWLHTIASCNAGYPISVQPALLALVVIGMLANSPRLPSFGESERNRVAQSVTSPSRRAVYCTRDQSCWHRWVECKMRSVVVRLKTHTFVRLQKSA